MTLLGGPSRCIVLRSQRTLKGEAMDTKSGVADVLAPVYFIGRTSRGEPFLTGDKSGVTKPNFNSVFGHSVNCKHVLLVR
jgi:hypothetical protein